jgi:bacteriocin-like protein
MAKSKPTTTSTKPKKPAGGAGRPAKTKTGTIELTEKELDKISGGHPPTQHTFT